MEPTARRRALVAAVALTLLALVSAGPTRLRACAAPDEPTGGAPVATPTHGRAVATQAEDGAPGPRRADPAAPIADPANPASPAPSPSSPDHATPPPTAAYGGDAGAVAAWAELTWHGAAPLTGRAPVALPTWESWLPDVGECSAAVISVPTPADAHGAWATVTVCLLGTCSTSAARQVEATTGPRTSVGLALGRCAVTLTAQP